MDRKESELSIGTHPKVEKGGEGIRRQKHQNSPMVELKGIRIFHDEWSEARLRLKGDQVDEDRRPSVKD